EICAGYLGQLDLAFQFTQLGEVIARRAYEDQELPDLTIAVGFLADSAYLLWKSNNRGEALSYFAKALDQLEGLPDPPTSTSSYALHMRLSYVITWIRQFLDGRSIQPGPDIALFTNLDNQEQLKNHPIPPITYEWLHLAWIEYHLRSGKAFFQRLVIENNNSDLPIVHVAVSELDLRHSLRESPSPDLVTKLEDYISKLEAFSGPGENEALANQVRQKAGVNTSGISSSERQNLFDALIFVVFLKYVYKGEVTPSLLEEWRIGIKQQAILAERLLELIDIVQRCIDSTSYDLSKILKDMSQRYEIRIIAAIFLSTPFSRTGFEDVDPEIRFYANT